MPASISLQCSTEGTSVQTVAQTRDSTQLQYRQNNSTVLFTCIGVGVTEAHMLRLDDLEATEDKV